MPDEYEYDVFVSYSHRDREWVTDELVPRLRQAGLDVLIDRQFPAGFAARESMARAVRVSGRVLLVVTSAWLESEHSAFESQVAGMLDPAGRRGLLVPLILEDVELPESLSNLTYCDYKRPSAEAWSGLLRDLSADLAETEPPPGPTRLGLAALSHLLRTDETVRTAIASYEIDLDQTHRQISLIGEYKRLHDGLQALEFPFRILESHRSGLHTEEDGWEAYEITLPEFAAGLQSLIERIRSESLAASERLWVEQLTGLLAKLDDAVAERAHMTLGAVCIRIRSVLDTQLSRIDARLTERACALRLTELVSALRTVATTLPGAGLKAEVLARFENGLTALEEIEKRFHDRVHSHNCWQQFYDQLRSVDSSVSQGSFDLLELEWPDLARALRELSEPTGGRDTSLHSSLDELESVLATGSASPRVQSTFRKFEAQARHRFNHEDRSLLEVCESLRDFGDPLVALRR